MKRDTMRRCFFLLLLFIFCFLLSFLIGKYPINPLLVIKVSLSKILPMEANWPEQVETVIFNIRMPRVIMGAIIGGGIACAGAVYQGIFQNPMASPDILGAANGSAFGAALGLTLGIGYNGISISAFFFGLIAVGIVYAISRKVRFNPALGLILSGIMVGSLFSAGVSFLKLVADPTNTLPAITYWLMGSLSSIKEIDVVTAGPIILIALIPIFICRWRLNLLTLGDEEAKAMGVDCKKIRFLMIICATLITAASVAVSGLIGWVGLVIPHLARMIVGSDYRSLLPASAFLGGSFLIMVDNLARTITTSEIPIGILTAFVGAPVFLYLIMLEGRRNNA